MKTLRIPSVTKLIFFGGGPLMLKLAQWASSTYQCLLITAPRQADEIMPDGSNLCFRQAVEDAGLQLTILDEVNGDDWLLKEITKTSIGLGFGEAWNFDAALLTAFDGRLFDFMGIPLPRYRGGAHYTWAILRNETRWGCHLQVINEEMVQGEFDSGELLASHEYNLIAGLNSPNKYFSFCIEQELAFIKDCIGLISSGEKINLQEINEEESLFFPRLNTKKNAWLNWLWRGEEIVQFINAFSDPYIGASTYVNKQRVYLKNARLDNREQGFHPYQSGLIVRITDAGVGIATTIGLVTVEVSYDEKQNESLTVGQRFNTPQSEIDISMNYKPDYKPSGDSNNALLKQQQSPEINSDRIKLRLVTSNDCTEAYVAWLNDAEVNQYMETRLIPQTLESIKLFVLSMIESPVNQLFAIIDKSSKTHIGNIKLGQINFHHKSAEVSYFIGEKEFWKLGYGFEALSLITQYALNDVGLEYIGAGAYVSNIASQRLLEKAGYELEGRMKNQFLNIKGQREDRLWYGKLKND